MTPADKLEALEAGMEGTAAEAHEVIDAVEKLWAHVRSPGDESARIAEQLAIGKRRANVLDGWVSELRAIRAELGEAAPVATLSVRMYRGHFENTSFDYIGDLPEGDYRLYTTPPATVPVEALREAVPTNWCDSLLTNTDGLGKPPWGCSDIERLLTGIRDRIEALIAAQEKK